MHAHDPDSRFILKDRNLNLNNRLRSQHNPVMRNASSRQMQRREVYRAWHPLSEPVADVQRNSLPHPANTSDQFEDGSGRHLLYKHPLSTIRLGPPGGTSHLYFAMQHNAVIGRQMRTAEALPE